MSWIQKSNFLFLSIFLVVLGRRQNLLFLVKSQIFVIDFFFLDYLPNERDYLLVTADICFFLCIRQLSNDTLGCLVLISQWGVQIFLLQKVGTKSLLIKDWQPFYNVYFIHETVCNHVGGRDERREAGRKASLRSHTAMPPLAIRVQGACTPCVFRLMWDGMWTHRRSYSNQHHSSACYHLCHQGQAQIIILTIL